MKKFSVIASSSLGTALEFYDFTLYGVFAGIIAQLYFPTTDLTASLIASWGAFAAGFLMRPFGAIIFGYVGDRYGRKKALTLAILCMGGPTLIIGLLPTYQTLGLLAPTVLILCRLLQGLCTGGEYNGAAIFSIEHLGKDKAGLSGGLITCACGLGVLGATAAGAIVTTQGMPEWAWRIPFVGGALLSGIGFYIRRKLKETPDFETLQQKKVHETSPDPLPLFSVITQQPKPMLMTIIVGCLNGALAYTLFVFLNNYLANHIGLSLSDAMHLNLYGLLSFMLFSPLLGLLSDKINRKSYFQGACLTVMCGSYPVFLILGASTTGALIAGQILLGALAASICGPVHAFIHHLFPIRSRYSGVAFSFSTGMALCGGTAPMISTYLINATGNNMMPAFFLMSCAIFCLTALNLLIPKEEETAPEIPVNEMQKEAA